MFIQYICIFLKYYSFIWWLFCSELRIVRFHTWILMFVVFVQKEWLFCPSYMPIRLVFSSEKMKCTNVQLTMTVLLNELKVQAEQHIDQSNGCVCVHTFNRNGDRWYAQVAICSTFRKVETLESPFTLHLLQHTQTHSPQFAFFFVNILFNSFALTIDRK